MANFNFNKVILGGRLISDPELRQTQSGLSVVSFSVAVNRKVKQGEAQQADFFNVTASSICIVGALQNSSWTNQQGQKQYRTDIVADEVMFVDSKGEGQASPAAPQWTEVSTDEGLPF